MKQVFVLVLYLMKPPVTGYNNNIEHIPGIQHSKESDDNKFLPFISR